MRKSLPTYVILDVKVRKVEIISGLKWVAVARHGLILWENDAEGLGIILKCLPDLEIELYFIFN